MQCYTGRDGNQYFKPGESVLLDAVDEGTTGFCLACGVEQDGVEPDARKYPCEACGERRVYGAENLLLRRLFHADTPRDGIEDSPHIENGRDNCNDHGTGEGQYHGRI